MKVYLIGVGMGNPATLTGQALEAIGDSPVLGVSGTVELLSQFIALKTMRRRSKEAAHAGTTD